LSLGRLSLLLFEQLADLAQLLQNLVGLLSGDALVLGGARRAERQQKRQRSAAKPAIRRNFFMRFLSLFQDQNVLAVLDMFHFREEVEVVGFNLLNDVRHVHRMWVKARPFGIASGRL